MMVKVDYKATLVNNVARYLNELDAVARPEQDVMGLATLHTAEHDFIPGGEDTVHLGLYCDFVGNRDVFNQLDALKQAAKAKNGLGLIGDLEIEVAPAGVRAGGWYQYVIRLGGCSLCIANRLNAEGTYPNVLASLGSLALHSNGGSEGLFMLLQEWLAALGWIVRRSLTSRADVCIDLVGVDIKELYKAFDEGDVICRAVDDCAYGALTKIKKKEWWQVGEQLDEEEVFRVDRRHRRVTGFRLGSDLQVCVYDKVGECKRKKDLEKLTFFQEHLWGGETELPVTRVEFRMKRDALKSRGVDTLDDWWTKRSSIIQYLVNQWCRFTKGHDSRHTERAEIHPAWLKVQHIAKLLFSGSVEPVKVVRRCAGSIEGLCRQLLGCASSALARYYGGEMGDIKDVLPFLLTMLEYSVEKYWSQDCVAKFREKCEEYKVRVPITNMTGG